MNAFVYILRCVTIRTTSAVLGLLGGTHCAARSWPFRRLPPRSVVRLTLVWSQDFDRIIDAIAAERQLKGWSHAKKER